MQTCVVTGRTFEPSRKEIALRVKLGIEGLPTLHPVQRFRMLCAFWQQWNLHRRKCDKTGKQIISVYPEDCPYPVWHKDEWVKEANPPGADFRLGEPAFPQLWDLFIESPIPHNMGTGCENCEYTDDYWYSKNCYLTHSLYKAEDVRYCYRIFEMRDCQFCVFSDTSERSVDLINSKQCYQVRYAYNSWNCRDSAFLYDCRNCTDCFFCSNLRNKQYCFGNEQLTKEAYEEKMKEWDLRSRKIYDAAKEQFRQMLLTTAWHRALFIDNAENVTGNYIDGSKDCENIFFVTHNIQDCVNMMRSGGTKDTLDTVGAAFDSDLIYLTINPQDHCHDIRFCYDMIQCKYMEYSKHCFQCEHCFGCAGLVGKKYCILNKQYEPEEYEKKKAEIIASMKQTGEYGNFFPGSFAAVPYEESLAGFYWPLSKQELKKAGFHSGSRSMSRPAGLLDSSAVPNRSSSADASVATSSFWDEEAGRPFQIREDDVTFCSSVGVPLPDCFYARRLKENFRMIPFNGETRTTRCAHCSRETQTSWPEEYDPRILCEDCYLKEVY